MWDLKLCLGRHCSRWTVFSTSLLSPLWLAAGTFGNRASREAQVSACLTVLSLLHWPFECIQDSWHADSPIFFFWLMCWFLWSAFQVESRGKTTWGQTGSQATKGVPCFWFSSINSSLFLFTRHTKEIYLELTVKGINLKVNSRLWSW